jgi:hypothetical protein
MGNGAAADVQSESAREVQNGNIFKQREKWGLRNEPLAPYKCHVS